MSLHGPCVSSPRGHGGSSSPRGGPVASWGLVALRHLWVKLVFFRGTLFGICVKGNSDLKTHVLGGRPLSRHTHMFFPSDQDALSRDWLATCVSDSLSPGASRMSASLFFSFLGGGGMWAKFRWLRALLSSCRIHRPPSILSRVTNPGFLFVTASTPV